MMQRRTILGLPLAFFLTSCDEAGEASIFERRVEGAWYMAGQRNLPCRIFRRDGQWYVENERQAQEKAALRENAIWVANWGGISGRLVDGFSRLAWTNGSEWRRLP
jgi:hypothetical protein